jgi:hypothetical protein
MVFVAVEEVLVEALGDEIGPVVARAEQAKHVGPDLQLGSVGPDVYVDMPASDCPIGCGLRVAAGSDRLGTRASAEQTTGTI